MQGEKSFVYFSMNIENLLRKHSIFYPASTVRILSRMFFIYNFIDIVYGHDIIKINLLGFEKIS